MATIVQKDVLIEAIAQVQGHLLRSLPKCTFAPSR